MDFHWIRASILVPFQYHVHYFLHAFFKHGFCIHFWWTFLNCWMPRTTFSIGKQTVWGISAFFAKVWQNNDFGIRFGIILEGFWYTFGILFRHHFLHRFWDGLFRISGSFWVTPGDFFALLDQKGSPRGIQKHPARSPFWHSGAAPRPEASKTWPVALKTSSVALKTGPRATCNGSFF